MKTTNITGLFNQMWVFGDSLSDYGSTAAYGEYESDWTKPYWSGTTFSNNDYNWQIGVRQRLGFQLERENNLFLPDAYKIYNSFAGYYGSDDAPSFAVGGASTGTANLFQIPGVTYNTGIASQVNDAIDKINKKKIKFESQDLVVLWGGANDVFIALEDNESLQPVLDRILLNQENNLKKLISSGKAKNVLAVPISAVQGNLAGVDYQVTFLTEAQKQGTLPAGWQELLDNGAVEKFYTDFQSMLERVEAQYPATNIIFFNPDYHDLYQEFGSDFGTFSDYGITNTIDHINNNSTYDGISNKSPLINTFLYFDETGHPTQSGHKMWEQAISLTLEQNKADIIKAQNPLFLNSTFNFTGQANSPLKLVQHHAEGEILEENGSFYLDFQPHAINNAIINGLVLEKASPTISALASLYTDDKEAEVSDDLITAQTALGQPNASQPTYLLLLMESLNIENNGKLIDGKQIIRESLNNSETEIFDLPGAKTEGIMVLFNDINQSPWAGSVLVDSEGKINTSATIELGIADLDQDFGSEGDQSVVILLKSDQGKIASDDQLLLKLNQEEITANLTGGEKVNFVYALGQEVIKVNNPTPKIVLGTYGDDYFDTAFPDSKNFVGNQQILTTGSGDDTVDVSQVGSGNRIDTGSGDDIVFAGTRNRIILGAGDDILFAGSGRGANRITLGSGKDQLWLTEDDRSIPRNPNLVSDFNPDEDIIGFANTVLNIGNKGELWNYQQVGNDVMISAFGQEIAQLLNTNITDNSFVFA